MQCLQAEIGKYEETLSAGVSAAGAAQVLQVIQKIMQTVGTTGFKVWLESDDYPGDLLEQNGAMLRFKEVSAKEFLTPLGIVKVERRLFQADRGGACYVPLDDAWGMKDAYGTIEVREATAYAVALMTPQEAANLLAKCALFQPSVTTLKKLTNGIGQWFEEHPEVMEKIRAEETPSVETKVLCVSLDGTNVRLAETGPKPGRPATGEGPKQAASCFKNAMVGSITCYGAVPAGERAPQRLQSRYVARMPEADSPTFRRQFEAEVEAASAACPESVQRVVLIDGAKALWGYVENQPQFAGWETLLDFQHTIEHTSAAADAVFGKGTAKARKWLDKKRRLLLEHDDGGRRVLRSLNRLGQRRLGKAAREELGRQRQFFRNNHMRMKYASFRARGLPIGSGPVEAAGKMLVKARFCRSGMRWTRRGGQSVLSARTLIKSQRWEHAWRYYRELSHAA